MFVEPYVLFNFGLSRTHVARPPGDATSGLSFHMYTSKPAQEPAVLAGQHPAARVRDIGLQWPARLRVLLPGSGLRFQPGGVAAGGKIAAGDAENGASGSGEQRAEQQDRAP